MSGQLVAGAAPGFFGKVSSHGDFVTRRLQPDFVSQWDQWLQAGLQHSRERLGAQWLAIYLNSPIWRFALDAGVCGAHACAGLLIPSVDRVGRHFPLTLACTVDGGGGSLLLDLFEHDSAWYGELETLALASLADGFALADFDAALAALGPPPHAPGPHQVAAAVTWLDVAPPQPLAPALCRQLGAAALSGQALFWTDGSPHVRPSLLVCRALPTAAGFYAMIDGGEGAA